jgi:predicted HAD superfamily Cof-like phosphohydrolase
MVDLISDIKNMNEKFGVSEIVKNLEPELLVEYMKLKLNSLQEEVDEIRSAESADDIVDGYIDAIVFSLHVLESLGVDISVSWSRVHESNMQKVPGIKESRPNKFGLPDLVKPEGWTAPTHCDNIGVLNKLDFPIDYTV